MRVLIIEDDKIISDNIKQIFLTKNFVVDKAFTGESGLEKSQINSYDLIILDINLPEITGLEVLNKIRNSKNSVPIIILTARDSFSDMKKGFEMGVDDYLIKPFPLKVLLMKSEALIQRAKALPEKTIKIKNLSINLSKKTVKTNKKSASLTSREFAILEYLVLNQKRFVPIEELMEHTMGEGYNEFSNTIKTHVSNIRKKTRKYYYFKKRIRLQNKE